MLCNKIRLKGTQLVLDRLSVDVWSKEAREAALEARRRKMKPKEAETSKVSKSESKPPYKGYNFDEDDLRDAVHKGVKDFRGSVITNADMYTLDLNDLDFSGASFDIVSKESFSNRIKYLVDSFLSGHDKESKVSGLKIGDLDLASDFSTLYGSRPEMGFLFTDIYDMVRAGMDLEGCSFLGEPITEETVRSSRKLKELQEDIDSKPAPENKAHVAEVLSKRTGIPSQKVSDLIRMWAVSSGDDMMYSVATQLAARDLFGLAGAKIDHFSENTLKRAENELETGPFRDEIVSLLKAQYAETQEWFKSHGMDPEEEVTLFRGVQDEVYEDDEIALQPLSSFSMSQETAKSFAQRGFYEGGTVFKAKVKVKDILASPRSGFGCSEEEELVVLGRPMSAIPFAYVIEKNALVKAKKRTGDMTSEDKSKKRVVNIDSKLENADWTKKSWDLPPYGSREFFRHLRFMGTSLKHFMSLPVHKLYQDSKKRRKDAEN